MAKQGLFKNTVVIWSEQDLSGKAPGDLGIEVEKGHYCSGITSTYVPDPSDDPDWDGTEFFEDGGVPCDQ
jgi:hypothetical protein